MADAPKGTPAAAVQEVVAQVTARLVLAPGLPPLLKAASLLLGIAAHLKLGMVGARAAGAAADPRTVDGERVK